MKTPLKVHLCWFDAPGLDPDCVAIARELYEYLHRPLGDDAVQRPGLEIPVEYGRDLASLLDAGDEPAVSARVIVVLLDAAAYRAPLHRGTVARAVKRWPASPGASEVLVPIVLDKRWHADIGAATRAGLSAVNRDDPLGDRANRRWRLPSEVAVVAGRALLHAFGTATARRPHVFISYTNADGGAELARKLDAHFKTRTQVASWYDENDVDRGSELTRQLDHAARDGVMLVVRTDHYSDSPWCGQELLTAKQAQIPIVTLLAAEDGEPSTSAYGGNHRTMIWKHDREWQVVGRCVQAWLHGLHFHNLAVEALEQAGLPADAQILARRPELLDLATSHAAAARRIIVYPDPPLTEGEAALLRVAQPSFRLLTPSTMLGRIVLTSSPSPLLADRTLGISLSHGEELPPLEMAQVGRGLVREHLNDALNAIVLATLHSGARITFGGTFQEMDSNAVKIAELHRLRRRLGTGKHSQLVCYVDGGAGDLEEPAVEHWPVMVPHLPGAERYAPPVRQALWRMAQRHRMTADTDGRMAIGGQLRPAGADGTVGYRGAWPGVLEECARTLQAGKALYLVGGFGGLTGALARMLVDDEVPAELTSGGHPGFAAELDRARAELLGEGVDPAVLLAQPGGGLANVEQLARTVLDRWRRFVGGDATAWANGLGVDDNRRLFRTTEPTEISHLVLSGLHRVTRRSDGELELALYRGDIASASNVDGYAVATVLDLPLGGGLSDLDAAMSGRLHRQLADIAWTDDVASVAAETDALAGRRVLVARVALPAPGTPVSAARIEALAEAAARRAAADHLESLAVTPFVADLGLSITEVVHAMLRGVLRGRGQLPRALVMCERDRQRYAAIRADLVAHDIPLRELREGAQPAANADTVVLHVDARIDEAADVVELRTAAYAPDAGQALVHARTARLSQLDWRMLRERPPRFEHARFKGVAIRDALLSPPICSLLAQHGRRRLLVLADELASGVPWELLEVEPGRCPAIDAGMVRRIKLDGEARQPPDHASADAQLRVLLVVDPTRDLPGAALEGAEVAQVLQGRTSVTVVAIHGADATRARVLAELARGDYDMLHYAGHAFFDAQEPARSGLQLAGRETLTAADLADGHVPRLIVLSACESARVRDARASAADQGSQGRALAEALLRVGVTTLLGTFFKVGDGAARRFASELHRALIAGHSVGHATREARRTLFAAREPDWGNFLLYGDDTLIL